MIYDMKYSKYLVNIYNIYNAIYIYDIYIYDIYIYVYIYIYIYIYILKILQKSIPQKRCMRLITF